MVRLVLLILGLLPLSLGYPSPLDIFSPAARGGCSTQSTPAFLAAAAAAAAQDEADISALRSADNLKWPKPRSWIHVAVYVHIIAKSKKPEDGWIPRKQVAAQMKVLNKNFAPQKIRFRLFGITRTVNPNWATDGNGTGSTAFEMKKKLRRGDYKTLNLYFQQRLSDDSLGYAYYPTTVTDKSDQFYLDGATILYSTVPGGTTTNYNLGKTVTHEVGHWFGLAHTFDGYSCTGPGDYIADTPIQKSPTYGCPIGRDSCPDGEGLDPIHNYMDYSFDACYEEFTPLQTKRMVTMWYTYRNIKNKQDWQWW